MEDIIWIVWMLLGGIGVAAGCLWYSRKFVGELVRKLAEIDATSPETAVALSAIHCRLTPPLRLALREGGALYETVLRTDGPDGEELYYLAPEKAKMAKAKYRNEGTTIFTLLLILGLLVLVGVLFTVFYPKISEFLQNFSNGS
ncbi:MAG: hypothetical protein J1E00_04575 [Oscillospiraceae bacterium]|nr:hypothetical protein [Oscillospiraceae bacterium]